MRKLLLPSIFFGLFLSISSTERNESLFQVISSHPHDVEELEGHIETVHQNGRLWIVELKEDAPSEVRAHLRAITGHEKSYVFNQKKIQKRALNFYHWEIKDILNEIDSELIKKDVELLSSYKTRAAGTLENREATQLIGSRFSELGYKVEQICYVKNVCSVIAEKKGSIRPSEVLLVQGHLDSVGEDFAGADDNGSGVAVLLEMARVLKDRANVKTLRFFVSNGEELGLLGAEHYVKELKKSSLIKEIKLAINMDMVGYNSNGIVELETNPNQENLAKWMAGLASQYTSLTTKITLGAWGSDHVPFLDAGVASILTIEDWSTKTPCYHKSCDLPDSLNYEYAKQIARLNVSAVMTKDQE